jgi:hypothetical protein
MPYYAKTGRSGPPNRLTLHITLLLLLLLGIPNILMEESTILWLAL